MNLLKKLYRKLFPKPEPDPIPIHVPPIGFGVEKLYTLTEISALAKTHTVLSEREPFVLDITRQEAARTANPEIVLTKYQPTVGGSDHHLEKFPEAVIYNTDGTPTHQLNAPIGVLLDPGHLGVRQHIANNAKNTVTEKDFDGVMMDEVFMVASFAPDFQGVNPRTGKVWTEEEFRAEQLLNMHAVRDAIGPDKLLAANSIRDGKTFFKKEPFGFVDVCDALVAEGWKGHIDWPLDRYMGPGEWKANIELNQFLAEKNTMLVAHCEFEKEHRDAATEVQKDQYDRYLYATFLMGYHPDYSVFGIIVQDSTLHGHPEKIQAIYHDYWEVDLGAPTNNYFAANENVAVRYFDNGVAAVNPTDDPGSYELPKPYKSLNGFDIQTITLAPHDGIILLCP